MSRAAPSLRVTAPPRATGDARIVEQGAETFLATLLKVELVVVPEGVAEVAMPEPLLAEPRFEHGDPTRSVVEPADSPLRRGAPSVTAWLVAHPWPGRPRQSVRLALFRGREAKFDKRATLDWAPTDEPSVGLGYELCARSGENPVGSEVPRLEPQGMSRCAASFAAESPLWPHRRSLRGKTTMSALSQHVVRLSDDFDWSYFAHSPRDQRVDALRPGDWLLIEGLSPAVPRLATQLPPIAAEARLLGGAKPRTAGLITQDLHVDPDRMRATLSLRAELPLEALSGDLHVELAFVEATAGRASGAPGARTKTKSPEEVPGTSAPVAPYALPTPRTKRSGRPPSETPFGGGVSRQVTPVDRSRHATVQLTEDDLRPPSEVTFTPAPSPPATAPVIREPAQPDLREAPSQAAEAKPEPLPPPTAREQEAELLRELGLPESAIRASFKNRPWLD